MRCVDTSALVQLFIDEAGSSEIRRLARGRALATSDLTSAEMHAAFARLAREGQIAPAEHDGLEARFERMWSSMTRVGWGPPILEAIRPLLRSHTLRGADAVQLTSALSLVGAGLDVTFVGCDERLVAAAVGASLPVRNPMRVSESEGQPSPPMNTIVQPSAST